ncbi:uncharacterized protein LOC110942824 [Helianthus annuus]|uniref:uncharacterized protein LOC110942824 n=1 Tax=Helianthus annuus TaxID=4232 RepID=UPI000B90A179|nr:uncharacterized protein LOC110942824 [Helianthus annuus]
MGGKQFTYRSDHGQKLSKLDRFLVCRGFMNIWPNAAIVALSSLISDHSPVVLSIVPVDFGPVPIRVFNSWLEISGLLEYVEQLSRTFKFNGAADVGLATKLRWIKYRVRDWVSNYKKVQDGEYVEKLKMLENLDMVAESRDLSPDEVDQRGDCKRFILEVDRLKTLDLKQKSRVRWAVDGDENTAYFHGVVNANTTNNRINGMWVDGAWVTHPLMLKEYVANFFSAKFKEPMTSRPDLICHNITRLTTEEADKLVEPFTLVEIKNAVWDCEGDRALGLDGINFKFIKWCWGVLQSDFVNLFSEFY